MRCHRRDSLGEEELKENLEILGKSYHWLEGQAYELDR